MHRDNLVVCPWSGVIWVKIAWHLPRIFYCQLGVPVDDLPRPVVLFPDLWVLLDNSRHVFYDVPEGFSADQYSLSGLTTDSVTEMRVRLSWVGVIIVTEVVCNVLVRYDALNARIRVVVAVKNGVVSLIQHPAKLFQCLVEQAVVVIIGIYDHNIFFLCRSSSVKESVLNTKLFRVLKPRFS